jgi:hypothetical protein
LIDEAPARAMSVSPLSRLWQARWTATREVEQKVCTVIEGPVRSNLYETMVARESRSLKTPRDDMPDPLARSASGFRRRLFV